MCRVAWGALVALGLASVAGTATAEDDFVWRRIEIRAGQTLWVSAEDIDSVRDQPANMRSLHVLWTHPTQRNLPPNTRYVFSEYTFNCGAAGVQESIWAWDAHDQPLEETGDREEQEVRPGTVIGALFDIACEGGRYEDDLELGSAREVLDYEASGRGRDAPARPRNRWDSGPGGPDGPDDEPREPSGEGQR